MVALPAKLTPPPASPKTPRPMVSGESSSSRNENPVARFEPTPLLLCAVPERVVAGNLPRIESAGIVD